MNPQLNPDQQSALAASVLRFRRAACDCLDETLCNMIAAKLAVSNGRFKDPANGRTCSIFVVIGDEAVEHAETQWKMPGEVSGDMD